MKSFVFYCLGLSVLLGGSANVQAKRRALLVGCSEYHGYQAAPLYGAANDVPRMEKMLREKFSFEDVTALAGWPEDEAKRPTRDNIAAAFARLINTCGKDDQVFVLLSGHGTKYPVDAGQKDLLDPANPEPDGYDEVFLPADYEPGKKYILDDQFGRWLDQLKNKGAHVWIVFDCCFSGTLTRGGQKPAIADDGPSFVRGLLPNQAGLDPAAIKAADQRALTRRARDLRSAGASGVDNTAASKPSGDGSLVAFYACQPFEVAREEYRPLGVERKRENRHGLFSYHLEQVLRQSDGPLTYGDVSRRIAGRIRAEMGRRGQTPLVEGDLDREVFGLKKWPERAPLFLEKGERTARVTGGELAGATKNAILTVYAAADRQWKQMLGRLRVTSATATTSMVEPYGDEKIPATPLEKLPEGARCRVLEPGVPLAKVRLAVVNNKDDAQLAVMSLALAEALPLLREAAGEAVEFVAKEVEADWLLVTATRESAKQRFGLELDGPGILLLPANPSASMAAASSGPLIHVRYRPGQAKDLAADVDRDLRKIIASSNLWKIAHLYGEGSELVDDHSLRLVVTCKGQANQPTNGLKIYYPGDVLETALENRDYYPYWYSLFYVSANHGIQFIRPGQIRGRNPSAIGQHFVRIPVDRMQVVGGVPGTHGYVLLASPMKLNKAQPNLSYLKQMPLGVAGKNRAIPPGADSPFQRLLIQSARGRPLARGGISPDKPQAAAVSWTVRNASGAAVE